MFNFFKRKSIKLEKNDVTKFYTMLFKTNPVSDIIGVIGKTYEELDKYIRKKYDKTYTILASQNNNAIIVVKEDYIQKYVILNTLDDLIKTQYKFERYII